MTYYCTIKKEGDEYIAQFPDMTNTLPAGFLMKKPWPW
jgi:hypothetical protein